MGWCWWGSWGDPGRRRVRICCKGAPGRGRRREEARNINVSLPAFRPDPGLCNRFGQTAPSRAPARTAVSAIAPALGPARPRLGAETCTLHSSGAFCPREVRLEVPARVQNARLESRMHISTSTGPTRPHRPGRIPPASPGSPRDDRPVDPIASDALQHTRRRPERIIAVDLPHPAPPPSPDNPLHHTRETHSDAR